MSPYISQGFSDKKRWQTLLGYWHQGWAPHMNMGMGTLTVMLETRAERELKLSSGC